jgi:Ala-tRNA(Pro) deacylase
VIERVVSYLEEANIPFRLAVYPMPEPSPSVAYPVRPDLLFVDCRVVLVNGSPAVACATAGVPMNMGKLGNVLGATVLDATSADLSNGFRGAPEPVPPLGGLFSVPLFVDEDVSAAPRFVFHAFSQGSYVELAYEDFARIERPRVVSFAQAGALPG